MTSPNEPITRVGLVAKARLGEAAGVLTELAGWLEAARRRAPSSSQTRRALAGVPPARPTVSRDELPRECDLVVVLGGDGTLIGMADRIADAGTRCSDPRRELRQPRLSHRDHAERAVPIARVRARRDGADRRAR